MKRNSSLVSVHQLVRLFLPLLFVSLSLAGCKKDDSGNSDGGGGAPGDGDGDDDPRTACDDDSECDDSLYCNGEETCTGGFCVSGKVVDCDDGIECTIDSCDESRDECQSTPPDEDGDGHADAKCLDEDDDPLGDDCDDSDPRSFPGNSEVCDPDNRDEDCDPTTIGIRDSDNDGYNDMQCCNVQEDGDLECGLDCDDYKANVNPEATEACDFLDNDCNGEVDEGVFSEGYPDLDHDGHGDASAEKEQTCPNAVGFSDDNIDCDDSDPEVFLGQFEICDGKDNNCDEDRLVDEIQQQAPWYPDRDGDTYGDPNSSPIYSCYRIKGRVLSQNDCDDDDNTVNPNATEICDGKDNNCNGLADHQVGINDFEDDDGDGVADEACGGLDCNDRDARTAEGADEVCDYVDNDCDGEVDEQTVQNIWYIDDDGDGWGVVLGSALASCDPLVGRATEFGDCNDGDPASHPGVVDYCDGRDNDCDGQVDEGATAYCRIKNALPICKSGVCQIFTCQAGFTDDPGVPGLDCLATAPPPVLGVACETDSECDNSNLCDGIEACVPDGNGQSFCQSGPAINCSPGPGTVEGDVVVQNGLDVQKLGGVSLITGDLIIDSTALSTLIGLEDLKTVGGDVIITANGNLLYLSGSALSNLEIVGGEIVIEDNLSLGNVNLPSLLSAKSVRIINNQNLVEVSGYQNLAGVSYAVEIGNNPNLETVSGLANLQQIGGNYPANCTRGEGVYCDRCLGGGLHIYNNPLLENLDTFQELERVGGDICIRSSGLSEVSFPALSDLDRSLDISDMPELETIELPALKDVGLEMYFYFQEGTPNVTSISAPELVGIGENLFFYPGQSFESLELPKLMTLGGNLEVELDTDSITSFDLSSLETVYEVYFSAYGESGLDIVTLPALETIETYGYFSISSQAVESFELPALTSVPYFNLYASGDQLEKVEFAQLETTDDFYLNLSSSALSQILAPSLVSVSSFLTISAEATGATELDLSSLSSVGSQLSVDAPADTIDLGDLSVVGTNDQDGDEQPDNDGDITLCITDTTAACGVVTDLIDTHGFSGTWDVCDQACNPLGQVTQPQL